MYMRNGYAFLAVYKLYVSEKIETSDPNIIIIIDLRARAICLPSENTPNRIPRNIKNTFSGTPGV